MDSDERGAGSRRDDRAYGTIAECIRVSARHHDYGCPGEPARPTASSYRSRCFKPVTGRVSWTRSAAWTSSPCWRRGREAPNEIDGSPSSERGFIAGGAAGRVRGHCARHGRTPRQPAERASGLSARRRARSRRRRVSASALERGWRRSSEARAFARPAPARRPSRRSRRRARQDSPSRTTGTATASSRPPGTVTDAFGNARGEQVVYAFAGGASDAPGDRGLRARLTLATGINSLTFTYQDNALAW